LLDLLEYIPYLLLSQLSNFWGAVQFDVKIKSADNDLIGVMFRYQNGDVYYRFRWYLEEPGRFLEKNQHGEWSILASDNVGYSQNTWYKLRVLLTGTHIRIFIDDMDTPVFDVKDTVDPILNGKIALYNEGNQGSFFDDVEVDLLNGIVLKLSPGQVLPSPGTPVTISISGVSDIYGNTLTEPLTVTFHPDDANANPIVKLADLRGEQSGDVVIRYVLSDQEGDTLSIRPQFSEDSGATWRDATVTGRTTGITKGEYSGRLIWHSAVDLPHTEQRDVQFRIVPSDKDQGTPDATANFHLDNNEPPSVELAEVKGERYGDIPVAYVLSDPEKDSLSIVCEYKCTSDTAWTPASVLGETGGIDSTEYAGTIVWRSEEDLPNSADSVLFRIIPSDNDAGASDTVLVLVDNMPPSITLTSPSGEQSGDVELRYIITNEGLTGVTLHCAYSTDSGATWHPATVAGDTAGITSDSYQSSVLWRSGVDLPHLDLATVRFRIVPEDSRPGRPGETADFHLDNNEVPSVVMEELVGERKEDVTISYRLSDPEGDTLDIVCEYMSRGRWNKATVSGKTTGIVPFQYAGSVVWNSKADLPEEAGNVPFRITPRDRDAGTADTIVIQLDNLGVPSIVLSDLRGEQNGDVEVSYRISDDEGDVIGLICEYSPDSGRNWMTATVKGRTEGIGASEYIGSVVWRSSEDLPGFDGTEVRFRVTPFDQHMGISDETADFHLDNNLPPSVSLTLMGDTQTEDVPIRYELSDLEGDTLSIRCEYSLDGTEWTVAHIVGDTTDIAADGYIGQIIWRSLVDLPNVADSVFFRVTPADNDVGMPDSLRFYVDNVLPAVTLVGPVGEQSGDVSIGYFVSYKGTGPVGLYCEYSVDSGTTWHRATVFGDTSGVGPEGSIVWRSAVDLPGVDRKTVRFRITPSSARPGIPDETEDFHLDNDLPPVASFEGIRYVQGWNVLVPYVLSDAEGDTLSLTGMYFKKGWKPIVVLSSILKDAYRGKFLWDARNALGYGDSIRVRIRLVPADRDTGEAVDTSLYVCSYLGDMEGDMDVDFEDLDRIRMAWVSQDISCDIGPAQGIPPELSPLPDGKVDFEDIMAFALMWNWWHGKYGIVAKPLAKVILPQDASVEVRSEMERDRLRVVVLSRRDGIGAYEVEVRYPPDMLKVEEVHRGDALGDRGVLFLEHRAEGILLVDAAKFGTGGDGDELVSVDFRVLRPGDLRLTVRYDLRAEEGGSLGRGTLRTSLRPSLQVPFISEVYPNPSNGSVTLDYGLPEDGKVRIEVYNLLGQVVRVLADGFYRAGCYRVVWDGRDASGRELGSGVYVVRMEVGTISRMRKVALIR